MKLLIINHQVMPILSDSDHFPFQFSIQVKIYMNRIRIRMCKTLFKVVKGNETSSKFVVDNYIFRRCAYRP